MEKPDRFATLRQKLQKVGRQEGLSPLVSKRFADAAVELFTKFMAKKQDVPR